MWSFFRGWRRKAGVVSLVIACIFASGWVRSFATTDWLSLSTRGPARSPLKFVSSEASVAILTRRFPTLTERMRAFDLSVPDWYSRPAVNIEIQPGHWFTWHWKLWGFGYATEKGLFNKQSGYLLVMLPYWFLVFPPTLLSAYLLLWKPRKRASPN